MRFRRHPRVTRIPIKICLFSMTALMLAVWAPGAEALPTVTTCNTADCHQIWTGGGGDGHTGHNGLGLASSCNACHVSIGDTPATATCATCHFAIGLANHHQNAGASACAGCHPGTPPPEDTPVPGYTTITAVLDPCDGSEERFPSRTTSLDNDGDLLYDGDDPDCQPEPEVICDDGIDNDGDGMIDCADQDCAEDSTCQTPTVEVECADGIDNDEDGMIDCADPDCADDPACQPSMEDCTDGVDNDGDGMIDCDDPNCAADAACQQPAMEDCTDGVDNDGDGMIDCDDQDCAEDPACQQPVMEDCDDGIDNDGDGFIDCMDPDCSADPACQPPPMEDCDDGIDNDEDGMTDCDDPDCAEDPACEGAETCPSFEPPPSHTEREEDDGCEAFHAPGYEMPFSNGCTACHGSELTGPDSGGFAPSCFTCHGQEWDEMGPGDGDGVPPDHTRKRGRAYHKTGLKMPFINGCTDCHGEDLMGGSGPSCYTCHGMKWKDEGRFDPPADHTDKRGDNYHKPGLKYPYASGCTDCHGSALTGEDSGGFAPSCYLCHKQKWKNGDFQDLRHYRRDQGREDDDEDENDDEDHHLRSSKWLKNWSDRRGFDN